MPQSSSSPVSSVDSGSQTEREPDLPQLVNYFVAAKRSIASTSHLLRANEIVNSARGLLEENAILSAKNAFIRKAVEDQVNTLEAIRYGIAVVGEEAWAELKKILKTLDSADKRLQATLTKLRTTPISSELQSTEERHLFDFIDFTNYTDLHDSLRACIDRYKTAEHELGEVHDAFENSMQSLQRSLLSVTPTSTSDKTTSPLPSIFRELESHAQDIAQNLQSLVEHYDKCVNALKHTEGGLPAASEATGDVPNAAGVSVESLRQDASPAHMTSSQRRDMLIVVARDANEVDEVVSEMRDRVTEMEELMETVFSHTALLRASNETLLSAVRTLNHVGKETKPHIESTRSFLALWGEERINIEQGVEDIESLREFYDGFMVAYDGVLREVQRRKHMEEEMEKVAADAEAKFAKLFKADLAARTAFKETQGEYIPRDLWPGVVEMPPKYKVIVAAETEGESVPEEVEQSQLEQQDLEQSQP